jgi:hypothetical protein
VENIDETLRARASTSWWRRSSISVRPPGVSGQFDALVFVEAIAVLDRVMESSRLPRGGVACTPESSRALIAKGYRLLFHASKC